MVKKDHKDIELSDEDIDDSVVAEEHAGDEVKKLKSKLKDAEAKAKEYLDSWQRAQADFANLRRRDEESKKDFVRFATLGMVEVLIPVLDSFNIALSHPSTSSGQATNIEPIYKQFISVLKQAGLEDINPVGEDFNPQFHEAVNSVKVESESEDNKIQEVLQAGYKLNDRIIRPAKVKVGEFKS